VVVELGVVVVVVGFPGMPPGAAAAQDAAASGTASTTARIRILLTLLMVPTSLL
jgi:hypothetical protein